MDKPYIFFEDVPDAAGNQKQLQTTKLKFIDATSPGGPRDFPWGPT